MSNSGMFKYHIFLREHIIPSWSVPTFQKVKPTKRLLTSTPQTRQWRWSVRHPNKSETCTTMACHWYISNKAYPLALKVTYIATVSIALHCYTHLALVGGIWWPFLHEIGACDVVFYSSTFYPQTRHWRWWVRHRDKSEMCTPIACHRSSNTKGRSWFGRSRK